MTEFSIRELGTGEEELWLGLDDGPANDDHASEAERTAAFRARFEERSAGDPRTFLLALDDSSPAGRLEGVFLDATTYRIVDLRCAETHPRGSVEDALVGYLATSFSGDGIGVLSSDRPGNAGINDALSRAGFEVAKRKAFVERSLAGELPEPGVDFTYVALAEVGRDKFVRVMTAASEGDPFEDAGDRDPDAEFRELVEMAGDRYDPECWFEASVGGQVVGVVLPQVFEDAETEGTLFYVAVLPLFRGRGYGRALHAAGLSMLRKRGVEEYVGSTDTRNKPMLRVFEANGCTRTATQLFYRPPRAPAG